MTDFRDTLWIVGSENSTSLTITLRKGEGKVTSVLLISMSRFPWKSSRKSSREQMLCRSSMYSRQKHGCEHHASRELLAQDACDGEGVPCWAQSPVPHGYRATRLSEAIGVESRSGGPLRVCYQGLATVKDASRTVF